MHYVKEGPHKYRNTRSCVCVCVHMCKTERKKGFDYGCVCEIVAKREIVWEGCQLEPAEKAVFLMIL